jgi:hypothetical protein
MVLLLPAPNRLVGATVNYSYVACGAMVLEIKKMTKPKRPDCFEFAMNFLGDPEKNEIRSYIEQLENHIAEEKARFEKFIIENVSDDTVPADEGNIDALIYNLVHMIRGDNRRYDYQDDQHKEINEWFGYTGIEEL